MNWITCLCHLYWSIFGVKWIALFLMVIITCMHVFPLCEVKIFNEVISRFHIDWTRTVLVISLSPWGYYPIADILPVIWYYFYELQYCYFKNFIHRERIGSHLINKLKSCFFVVICPLGYYPQKNSPIKISNPFLGLMFHYHFIFYVIM